MNHLLVEFLSQIERQEAALLSWGLVDGALAENEIRQSAEDFLTAHDRSGSFADAYQFLEELVARGLVFRWEEESAYRYRSRMAESIRLLARLRQLFPRHMRQPGEWARSPTLVADFRFLVRAREYPRRDLAPPDCLRGWVDSGLRLSVLQQSALRVLLGMSEADPLGFPLAGFQNRATARILREAAGSNPSGTMICAGTGSGKTLAFYVPALTNLVGQLERDSSPWTRVLALYPRNELLKDQFTETIRQNQRINPILKAAGKRPICVGAYFGPTPRDGKQVTDGRTGNWEVRKDGRICPFVVCPQSGCVGSMLWRDDDCGRDIERLVCETCGAVIGSDEIVLTRRRMVRTPPDILFTTTEMMNQRLTDSYSGHLFGVGTSSSKKPCLVLLDEAHTYSGVHGAQVAFLLRRWRHRTQTNCHFVGLSATLMEASLFFAQLTGLPSAAVEEISPEVGEMLKEGMEYMAALRGDPVSGASLLSTTIQTAMLLRRVLDPTRGQPSEGVYGRKVFLFTDDLDVKNRMYFNLLDAEGQDYRGRADPVRHPQGSLANLRNTGNADEERRFWFGQSWRLCEMLGHDLQPQRYVRIGRVSSQDSGVDANAELIVATASLEVGFNDPDVGAVLQHKAPRDSASFLQRKGRAGRGRNMRPWTVVVLSDFGRDRLAYQGYDLLFDPELKPRDLPLGNRHVLKMQAVGAALDWMSFQLTGVGRGHVWREASAPAADVDGNLREQIAVRQKATAEILARVLQGGEELDNLTDWLKRSLRLSQEDDVKFLLWESPRALMTEVLPTWQRRVDTQWKSGSREGAEYRRPNHPLPEFLPANLFSELNLPEVIVWAEPRPGQPEESHPMTVAAALREFAPGRISRRFGITHGMSRHWIPVDLAGQAEQTIDVGSFCPSAEREDLGMVGVAGSGTPIRVLRPWALHVRQDAPRDLVKDSSNAFLIWHSQLIAPATENAGVLLDLPVPSPWAEILQEIRFFTHRDFQPAMIRRYATGSRATVNGAAGQSSEFVTRYVVDDGAGGQEPVALGFAFEADAIRIRVRIPLDGVLLAATESSAKIPALRAGRFRWRVQNEARFDGSLSSFERGWIAEVVLCAVGANAVRAQIDPLASWAAVRAGRTDLSLQTVLDVVFQTLPTEEDDPTARIEQDRLQELRQTLREPRILAVLDDLVVDLWQQPDAAWSTWLRDRFLVTLGAAFRDAIQQVCPEIDVEDLFIDAVALPGAATGELWISENSPGGGGIVERLLPLVAESPRRFLDLLRASLNESDYEISDAELQRILRSVVSGADALLAGTLREVRSAQTLQALTAAFRVLRSNLHSRGIRATHTVLTGLSSRLLRPGSNIQTDQITLDLFERWRIEETRLGFELDARSLVYALSHTDELDRALHGGVLPIGPNQDRRTWRFNALMGMVWPRGTHARNHALTLRSPYAELLPPERLIVLGALGPREPQVRFGSDNWRARCERQLIEQGRVALVADRMEVGALRPSLVALMANALDLGSLLVYPRLRGIERSGDDVITVLELVAAGQIAPSVEEAGAVTTARLIVKTAKGNRDEVRDLLESLFAIELISPGEELWIVSPWISDLALLDNRSGGYAGLEPAWPKRHLSLAELLVYMLQSNPRTVVRVVTRPVDHNLRFCERVRMLAGLENCGDRLLIDSARPELHTKGLVATSFALNGSMNFTRNGVEVLDETVQLETDAGRVAQFRFNLHGHYG